MATKLVMRTSREEFVDYIRQAPEGDAWRAIGDAVMFAGSGRVSKAKRATLDRTIDLALAAYEQTFGTSWTPF